MARLTCLMTTSSPESKRSNSRTPKLSCFNSNERNDANLYRGEFEQAENFKANKTLSGF